MLGKIAIILAVYTVLIFPIVYFGETVTRRLFGVNLVKNTEILVYLIPVYAIVIIVLGHLSIKAKEGYGLWLQVSMGLGYLIWAGIIFFIVLLISRGIDLSGIR